ncbi:MAG TPA: hypothetical protein VF758_03600 [Candidatus Acidoferrum sp.]
MDRRRKFLMGLAVAGVLAGVLAGAVAGTVGRGGSVKEFTARSVALQQPKQQGQEPSDEGNALPNPEKAILEANDKDMKKKVRRLYELASELKTEVEKTDSSKVLSMNLVKKAEEIEKLAREIKNRSRG